MTLSLEAISEFKEIYARQFGEKLSDIEAGQKALATLKFFRQIIHVLGHRLGKASDRLSILL